ncbi:response regulator [Steroidobacter cummioxidans]|uniref:response regulator n=1 Tax=Steroidobacter cummioxidans TaxID=1803913 RepID=UPI000E315DED|nr:response regulator [Steroidobacter cummioxidans]
MSAHVLIIEDNEMSLALAEYLLRDAGYTVSSATDGGSGMRLALENTADLILCDLDLPVIEGPQLVQALRANNDWHKVPVLAFTAASMREEQRQELAADFDGCIVKPVDPVSFAATIGQHLASELHSQG